MYRLSLRLRAVWRTRARYRVIHGGRASSKSHDAGGIAVYLAAS
ncbi:terminase large subunit [Pseudomonas phage WP1]